MSAKNDYLFRAFGPWQLEGLTNEGIPTVPSELLHRRKPFAAEYPIAKSPPLILNHGNDLLQTPNEPN